MSVKRLRHSASTRPRHSSSEVRLTDSPPYHKQCDMKPLAVSGFGFSAYATSPPHHPTSLPPCRHVNPCARPSADLSCHFTIPVDQSEPATSPMTSSDLDPTNDVMLTSSQKTRQIVKKSILWPKNMFLHSFRSFLFSLLHAVHVRLTANLLNQPGDLQSTNPACSYNLCSLFYQVFFIIYPPYAWNSL